MSNKDLQRSYIYPNKATTCGKQIRAQSSHYFYLSHAYIYRKKKTEEVPINSIGPSRVWHMGRSRALVHFIGVIFTS